MKTLIGFFVIIAFFSCISFLSPVAAQEYTDDEVCGFTEEEQEIIENMVQLGRRG